MKRERSYYSLGDGEGRITTSQLQRANKDTKRTVMRSWFFENYADPVEHCPYESAEGGYQYIYGGPYDALDVLSSEFSGTVPDAQIEQLADELNDISAEWSGNPDLYASDDYFYDSVGPFSSAFDGFSVSLENARLLLEQPVSPELQPLLIRLIFANVIATLEAYLSDFFVAKIKGDAELMKRFVETTPKFTDTKFSLSDIHKALESLDRKVKEYLGEVLWHNLAKVRMMYKATLDLDFPDGWQRLFVQIERRHDIVHRNGKTPDGQEQTWTRLDVEELVAQIEGFVDWIEKHNVWPKLGIPAVAPADVDDLTDF